MFGRSISIRPGDNTELYVAGSTGLNYTTDDGASWTSVLGGFAGNAQLQPANSTVVVHDPFNPALQLAGSISNGVYRRIALPPLDSFVPGVDGFNAQNIRAVGSNTLDRVHVGVSDSFGATFSSFRSVNNGLTWSQANSGLEADQFRALVVDPNDSEVIYAGGRYDPKPDNTGVTVPGNGGLYKSTNGGINWTTIDSGIPLTPAPFAFSLFGTVRDIAVDPFSADPVSGESQILYATGTGRFQSDGMGGFVQEAARIYKSVDAGATWVASDIGIGGAELGASGRTLFASGVQIIVDPTDVTGQTLYMATFIGRSDLDEPTAIENGVFKSIDGGASWSNIGNGLPRVNGNPAAAAADVLSLAFDPTDITGQTLYASTNDLSNSVLGTVYKTIDGGANWAFSGTGLENRDVRDLAVDPLTGNVYAAVADPLGNGDGGVFVSEDGGATWASVSTGFPSAAVALKLELDNTGANLLLH
ncbi:MAG: WD40/YVTN/BNR-like repeat-containing protein, partial [Wenzhouxiangellaceae bacterium]